MTNWTITEAKITRVMQWLTLGTACTKVWLNLVPPMGRSHLIETLRRYRPVDELSACICHNSGMSNLRVLVADDDPIIRLDLKQMLTNLGYDVVAEAGDGQEAVDQAKSFRPDICVLDIKMPKKDGIAAVEEIVGGEIAPAILLTAYSDRELIDRAKEAGAFAYLVKPFKPNDLPPAIELAVSRYEQNRELCSQVADLTERLDTRKIVERAKGVLIERQGLSESEAYRRIQQSSMNARKSMREVAEAILLAQSVE